MSADVNTSGDWGPGTPAGESGAAGLGIVGTTAQAVPQTQPAFLAIETREGRATLAGRRRLLDDFDEATEIADQIDGQVFALEPIEPAAYAPVPAINHVRLEGAPYDNPLGAA